MPATSFAHSARRALAAPLLAWCAAASGMAPDPAFVASADPDWHIALAPPDAGEPAGGDYTLLVAELARYRAIAAVGGWRPVPSGAPLALGARDPRVVALRARLRTSGDYEGEMGADPWFFDGAIDRGLRRVQRRHGLIDDGILGELTLAQLNVPVEDVVGRLEAVVERWRWLPRELGSRHVWINVARAQLDVIENAASTLSMRVVVGHRDRPTPSLAGELSRVVFNPTWSVPPTIAVEDLLPRQQEDPGFLARNRIAVQTGAGMPVETAAIDWGRLGRERFPYRLVQAAGPGNSLGRIKIAFENPYDIYLHDTPARGMFGLNTRMLSSGCVRLEDASALATVVIANDRAWAQSDTLAQAAGTTTRTINVRQTLPIWIVYLTVWTENGELRFGRDLYQRDVRLLAALRSAG